jgi:hypothetical protein
MTRIPRRRNREDRVDPTGPLRFEYCCGAGCDDECRRARLAEETLRMSPRLGLRVG